MVLGGICAEPGELLLRGLQTKFDGKCKVGAPSFAVADSRKLINLYQLNYQLNYKINEAGYLLATLNAVHLVLN